MAMNEKEWLRSDRPERMLRAMFNDREYGRNPLYFFPTSRKFRLLACAAARRLNDFGKLSPVQTASIEMAEKYSDGAALAPDLLSFFEACPIADGAFNEYRPKDLCWMCCSDFEGDATIWHYFCHYHCSVMDALVSDLIRDVIGNPFRRCPLMDVEFPSFARDEADYIVRNSIMLSASSARRTWRAGVRPSWINSDVVGLASEIYDSRHDDGRLDPRLISILVNDCLPDAGCDSEPILRHFRGDRLCDSCMGENSQDCKVCDGVGWISHEKFMGRTSGDFHVRGCWAMDLILEKW